MSFLCLFMCTMCLPFRGQKKELVPLFSAQGLQTSCIVLGTMMGSQPSSFILQLLAIWGEEETEWVYVIEGDSAAMGI